jgi:predicted transcriptional regulator
MNIKINIDEDIGFQMKMICEKLNLKHKDVAKALNISESLFSYYLNNKRTHKVDILRSFLKFCREHKNGRN